MTTEPRLDRASESAISAAPDAATRVRHFRQILLWPIYLMPLADGADIEDYLGKIVEDAPGNPWREIEDEFTGDPNAFQERHYNEFVAFLPPVQRFLYGQGLGKSVRRGYGESPIRVLRRTDVAKLRVTLDPGAAPLDFGIAHIDLYFFFDIELAMLALEIHADDLPLATAQEVMFRLGRAYPVYWHEDGRAGQCLSRVEWVSEAGAVLAVSDYENRQKYLAFVCTHRAPCVAAHWDFLLRPLVLHHTDQHGAIRYRQLEYQRMPLLAYLAMAAPEALTPADKMRLALACGAGGGAPVPAQGDFAAFSAAHGYRRKPQLYDGEAAPGTGFWTCGHTLIVTGDAGDPRFTDAELGGLAKFRHQHFLLFLIAHFHKAALQMFSDRLSGAVSRLEVGDSAALGIFRHETRQALEKFLRFTHRYWFYEVSDQVEIQELFDLCRRHLDIDRLYADIRQEVQDMNQYLEGEAMRRQNDTVVRLTVVTTFGLIGAVVTGFLGMNLFAWADETALTKLVIFAAVFVPTTLLTLFAVRKSRKLSAFLDILSDDRHGIAAIWRAFRGSW